MSHDRNLYYRTSYAIEHTSGMKAAISEFYYEFGRWPMNADEVSSQDRVNYPDGGFHELARDRRIRIRFTVKPELRNGSMLLISVFMEDEISWGCQMEGGLSVRYLPGICRE